MVSVLSRPVVGFCGRKYDALALSSTSESSTFMRSCQLIICERESHFAPALRRELASSASLVVETRSLPGCEAALVESPESLVVIEATTAILARVVDFLSRLQKEYPGAAAVVVLNSDTFAAEPLLDEVGAIGVFRSVLEAPAIARLTERKLATASGSSELSLHEFVAERLPWPAYATR
jgi:hypothetical protein